MATSKAITYIPNVKFKLESLDMTKNNDVWNFAYPENFPIYKDMVKYLQNCFLSTTFNKTPSVIYNDYLRDFWCTAVVTNPDVTKDSIINFTVKNGRKTLSFD